MTVEPCTCGRVHEPGLHFYASIVRDGRTGLLAGPYATHAEALAIVPRAREVAHRVDKWSWFDAFGTVSIATDTPVQGTLNQLLAKAEA